MALPAAVVADDLAWAQMCTNYRRAVEQSTALVQVVVAPEVGTLDILKRNEINC